MRDSLRFKDLLQPSSPGWIVMLTTLFCLLAGTVHAQATFQDFGYINAFDVKRLPGGAGLTVQFHGNHLKFAHNIPATLAEVPTYLGCFKGEDYLAPADAASTIAAQAAAGGFKLVLNLQWVLFEKDGDHCQPNIGDRLRMDWQDRLMEYAAHAGGLYNSSNTAFMIIHSEVNNSPAISQTDMVNAAQLAIQLFPGIKAAGGYPTTVGAGGFPAHFPWPLRIIFTWAYDVTDPRDPSYASGRFADLVSRLQVGQTVGVLVEGFSPAGDPSPRLGISGEYLGTLARRWCDFAQMQPTVEHVIGYYWGVDGEGGTDEIIHLEAGLGITALEGAHRAVARAAQNQLNGSCWATGP